MKQLDHMRQQEQVVKSVDVGGQEVATIAERGSQAEESQDSIIRLASMNASPGRVTKPPGVEPQIREMLQQMPSHTIIAGESAGFANFSDKPAGTKLHPRIQSATTYLESKVN